MTLPEPYVTTPPPNDPLADALARLQRLEETQAFSEHAHDTLTEQLHDLYKRIAETAARLARLEDRLSQLGEESAPDSPADEPE